MKKLKFLTLLVVAVLLFCGANCQWFGKTETKETSQVEEKVEQKATVIIDDGTGSPKSFDLEVKEETVAFDLLKEATEQAGLKLDYSESSMGVLIKAIGDKVNGQDGNYWMFYLNGGMASVGVDKQKVKAQDKVEFKFEKSSI